MREFAGTFAIPTEEDIRFVAGHMREEDRRELKRWTAQEPEYELRHSVAMSEVCWTARMGDGKIVCIFGACPASILDNTAVIWSLSTDEVDKHPVEFCVGSKAGVDLVMRSMPDVEEFLNWVDLDYTKAVRWVEWFGGTFAIGEKRPGIRGGRFGQFYITNPYFKED